MQIPKVILVGLVFSISAVFLYFFADRFLAIVSFISERNHMIDRIRRNQKLDEKTKIELENMALKCKTDLDLDRVTILTIKREGLKYGDLGW